MEYHEAANFLFDLRRFRPRPGTESTAELLDALGNPHDNVDAVQVAGSNGKGSTARMVERICREAGLSVGLYTSPHLEDLRERIRVDGRKIPRSAVTEYVDRCREYVRERAADGQSPTFFEAITAMALWHFGQADVDVAVLEVGIGGKYDATSVVDPVASAVTSVSLEHTGVIGDTVEEIATDKAHVAPANAPLVTAVEDDVLEAVQSVAGDVLTVGTDDDRDVQVTYRGRHNHTESIVEIEAPNGLAGVELSDDESDPDVTIEANLPLLGTHQAENAGIAATLAGQAIASTGTSVSTSTLARGLRGAYWPGRFEVMETGPLVVLDGAHNPGACRRLTETLNSYEYEQLHLVVGAMHDKDHREMAAALPTPDTVVTCRPDLDRAEDPDVLATVYEDAGVNTVDVESAVGDALASAIERAESDDCVLVTGSLFAISEARTRWTRAPVRTRIDDLDDARTTLSRVGVTPAGTWRMRGKAVHRVVRTRVRYRQAQYLKEELLSLGGECAISGVQRQDEPTDVVLMGTLSQFKRLASKLECQPYGLATVADELRETLSIGATSERTTGDAPAGGDDGPTTRRYPWIEDDTAVMGILNVTPDSFHDGGQYDALDDAVARAEAMVDAGVDIIDVGGESTRPGADPVPVESEIDRVVPVVERLAELDPLVSVDTRRAAVARAALEAGADVINDVSGLSDPAMRFVVAEYDAALILMHSVDAPVIPDHDVTYDDVVDDVIEELSERALLAEKAGIDRGSIVIDPGIGFGKSPAENFELLDRLGEFRSLGCPVLVGHSHKSMFEHVGLGPEERAEATLAATALAVDRGADVVRVHDVSENVRAVRTALAVSDPDRFGG